jgi:glycosyltransferase involved in cell wall biosynthesis
MKILALGSLSIPYIGTNWFEAMRRELGSDCIPMDAHLFLASAVARPKATLAQHVLEAVRVHRPDYLFVYQDWCFEDLDDELFDQVRAAGVRTVCWHPDDEPEAWYARNRKYDHHYDIIATHASRGAARRKADGYPGKLLYLPWGYNHRRFRADDSVPKQWDIVFVGKNKVFDHATMAAKEDGAARQSALYLLARIAEDRGYSFRLFGEGWEQHPTLARFSGGFLSDDEMLRVFQASRLVFNPAWNADGGSQPQTKLRHFEVPGAGALQVCNWNPELAELFVPGEEILFYRSEDELAGLVTDALSHPAELERKCRAAGRRALAEHTLERRVRSLADYLQKDLGGEPAGPAPSLPRIERRICPDRAALEAVLAEVRSRPFPADSYFQILPGTLVQTRSFDEGLGPFTREHPGVPLRVRTAVEVTGQTKNPMQFHWSTQVICTLAETFGWRRGSRIPPSLLRSRLNLLEEDGRVQWLGNWIIPAPLAAEALEAWLARDSARLEVLEPRNTGLLQGHVFVDPVAGWNADALKMNEIALVLQKAAVRGWGVVFYGVRGILAGQVLALAADIPGLRMQGVVDQAVIGQRFGDLPVLTREDLQKQPPDLILINAVVSGPELLAMLEPLEPRTRLVPVFNLDDPRWDILLP